MRRLSRTLAVVLSATMLSSPLYADVARPRKAAASGDAVKTRMTELGVRAGVAETTVASLTGPEVRFFAQDSGRI